VKRWKFENRAALSHAARCCLIEKVDAFLKENARELAKRAFNLLLVLSCLFPEFSHHTLKAFLRFGASRSFSGKHPSKSIDIRVTGSNGATLRRDTPQHGDNLGV
jgi:hypothetical protein